MKFKPGYEYTIAAGAKCVCTRVTCDEPFFLWRDGSSGVDSSPRGYREIGPCTPELWAEVYAPAFPPATTPEPEPEPEPTPAGSRDAFLGMRLREFLVATIPSVSRELLVALRRM